jgi:hypothetical protein
MSLTFKITKTDYDNDLGILSGSWSTDEKKAVPFYLYRVIHQAVSIFVLAESETDARSQVSCGTPSISKYDTDVTVVRVPFRIRGHSGLVFGGTPPGKWRDATLADLQKSGMKACFSDLPFTADGNAGFVDLLRGYEQGWRAVGSTSRWIYCQVWEPAT